MALTVQYALRASQTPAVRVPGAVLDPNAGDPTPLVSTPLAAGDITALLTKFNALAVRVDNAGRYGGGGYAIAEGCGISEGAGLTLNVAAGVIQSDGHQPLAAQTQGQTDGVIAYIWALQTAVLSGPVIGSLTAPAATAVYLGRVKTAGGLIAELDRSGVLEKRFGLLFRKTGDAAAPDDSPPAGIALLTETAGGLYLWDGTEHRELGPGEAATLAAVDAVAEELEQTRRLLREVFWRTWSLLGYEMGPELAAELEQAASEAG